MRKSQLYSIAFGFSLLVLLSFSILLYDSINSSSEYSKLVQRSLKVMNYLQTVHSKIIDAETGQRGFLLTKDSTFLAPLLRASIDLPPLMDSLKSLIGSEPTQKVILDTLKQSIWDRLHVLEELLNRSSYYNGEALATRLKIGKMLMDKVRSHIAEMQDYQRKQLDEQALRQAEFQNITPAYFKTIISITALVSFVSFVLLMQEMKQRTTAQALLETRFHALNQSNAELRQIAHVTSHDLQEPLRKIRIFSDALVIKFQDKIPPEVATILHRINSNALRMRELVADLSAFTGLSTLEGKISQVNLTTVLETVLATLSTEIRDKNASFDASALPSIQGYSPQLSILFTEIIENALKFSKPGVDPAIKIMHTWMEGAAMEILNPNLRYLLVSFTDNGMGFEKEYSNKIFILFQKLHGEEEAYDGKGLGLSLCQRIMSNHKGFITATGQPGVGATFNLYFPV